METVHMESTADGSLQKISSQRTVVITPRKDTPPAKDSSKVRSKRLVSYKWETQRYSGNLIAMHHTGTYIAYILHSAKGSSVRVMNRKTNGRVRIQGFVGTCCDVAWSRGTDPLLACADSAGNLFVYSVSEQSQTQDIGATDANAVLAPTVTAYLTVRRDANAEDAFGDYRVVWCPWVPEEKPDVAQRNGSTHDGKAVSSGEKEQTEEDGDSMMESASQIGVGVDLDEMSRMLVIIKGKRVEILVLDAIHEALRSATVDGDGGGTSSATMGANTTFDVLTQMAGTDAYVRIDQDSNVTDARISPDATALALATLNGQVKFFILESFSDVKCAHEWTPHDGKSVDSLHFLDIIDDTQQEQFWRTALTSANHGRELKLWNCEDWSCVAMLCVLPCARETVIGDDWDATSSHGLKVQLDPASSVILLTDVGNSMVYCVELSKGAPSTATIGAGDSTSTVVSSGGEGFRFAAIHEFPLVQPVLDTAICNLQRTAVSLSASAPSPPLVDVIADGLPMDSHIQLFAINPSGLLEMRIKFESGVSAGASPVDNRSVVQSPPPAVVSFSGQGDAATDYGEMTGATASSVDVLWPNGRQKTNDDEQKRPPTGSSPESAEVSEILHHQTEEQRKGDENEDETSSLQPQNYDALAREDSQDQKQNEEDEFEDEDRPSSPVGNTLASHATPGGDADDEDEEEGAETATDKATTLEERLATSHITSSLTRMSMELERLGAHSSVYAEELRKLHHEHSMLTGVVKRSRDEAQIAGEKTAVQMKETVAEAIRSEVANVLPQIVHMEHSNAMARVEANLLTEMQKMLMSKPMIDAYEKSLSDVVAKQTRLAIEKAAIPVFDTFVQSLMSNINDIFQKGVTEFVQQYKGETSLVHNEMEEWRRSAVEQLTAVGEQMRRAVDTHTAEARGLLDAHAAVIVDRVETSVGEASAQWQTTINEHLQKFRAQLSATPTPSLAGAGPGSIASPPQQDRQMFLRGLARMLEVHDYNSVFEKALSMSDLDVVVWVCGRVDPSKLFAQQPCPLEQAVILSLMHQLASDSLQRNADIKLKYLHEAMPSVDVTNSDVSQHLSKIVATIKKAIQEYMANPTMPPEKRRQAKMVLMTAQALSP